MFIDLIFNEHVHVKFACKTWMAGGDAGETAAENLRRDKS